MPFGKRTPFRPQPAAISSGMPFLPLRHEVPHDDDALLDETMQAEMAADTAESETLYVGTRGGRLTKPSRGPGRNQEFVPDVSQIGKPWMRETEEEKSARRKVKALNFTISFALRFALFFAMIGFFNANYIATEPDNWFLVLFGVFLLDCFRAVNKAATRGTI
jgi:hypothetical protein